MMSSKWFNKPLANLIILIPMVCWFAFCLDIIVPALPIITDDFGVSSSLLQHSMSLFLLICGLTQLSIRSMIILIGRRSLTVLCYCAIVLGCFLGAKAHNLFTLIFARCLQAAGSSGTLMISFISVRDITQDSKLRANLCSYLSSAIAISPILIPVLGAMIIEHKHWHFTFTYMMILVVIHGILMLRIFPTLQSEAQLSHQQKNSWPELFSEHASLAYLLLAGILGGTLNFLFLSHSSYIYIVNFESSGLLYGYFFSVVGIVYMMGCFIFPVFSKKLGILKTIILGHSLVFCMMFLVYILNLFNMLNATIFTVFAAISHFGSGFLLTGSIVGLMSQPKLATDQVVGVYGCSKFILPALLGWCSMSYGASLYAMSSTMIILCTITSFALIPLVSFKQIRFFNAY